MTYSAAYFTDGPLGEQIANWMTGWSSRLRRFLPSAETRQAATSVLAGLAILTPSLVTEMAPLVLLWHSHLPVWQMSAMMGASWVVTWWLTWVVIVAVKAR